MDSEILRKMERVQDEQWWFKARRKILVDRIVREAPPRAKILDIGSGTGANLVHMQNSLPDAHIIGLDSNKICRDACEKKGFKIISGTADHLEFSDDAFDLVTMLDVMEHLEYPEDSLKEIRRVIRPGGKIILTVPALQMLWGAHDEISHHYRRYERSEVIRLLEENGFRVNYISYYNFFLFPLAFAVRMMEKVIRKYRDEQEIPPFVINEIFYRIFLSENFVIKRNWTFPIGLSIICIAEPTSNI